MPKRVLTENEYYAKRFGPKLGGKIIDLKNVIFDLPVSSSCRTRLFHTFLRKDILSLSTLKQMSINDISKIPGIGTRSVTALADAGLLKR